MIKVIPLSQTESNFQQVVALDGIDFILGFLWNERDSHWFMTVKNSEGTDICTGIKVVCDIPLVVHESSADIWPGDLWCVDTTGGEVDPGLRDFGTRCLLLYVEEESVA